MLHDAVQTIKNLIFTLETKLGMAFHSCLSTECSYMVSKGFKIEFHAEFKNELLFRVIILNSS